MVRFISEVFQYIYFRNVSHPLFLQYDPYEDIFLIISYNVYAPNFEKMGSILLWASVSVRASVRSKINQARVLKFHIWIPRQKIAYPYFFSCLNYLPLPSYAPFKD